MNGTEASQRGFTLVELLLVLAILSTAAGLAVPRFQALQRGWTIEEDVRNLAAELTRARVDAVRLGSAVRVSFDARSPARYGIHEPRKPETVPSDFRALRDREFRGDQAARRVLRFRSTANLFPSAPDVVFRPDGSCSGAIVLVRSQDPDREYTVTVDPVLGSTRVRDGANP